MLQKFFRQFAHPQGTLGWIAGQLMAVKNGARSSWALELLEVRGDERVLEVGFGPGVDLQRLSDAVGERGYVAGADASALMVRQASKLNRKAIARGTMVLKQCSATSLQFDSGKFDAVLSINSAPFWPDCEAGVAEIARVLKPTGRALIVLQPMWRGATAQDSEQWLTRLMDSMQKSGLVHVTGHRAELPPVRVIAAWGQRGQTSHIPVA